MNYKNYINNNNQGRYTHPYDDYCRSDFGDYPFVTDIQNATLKNNYYRTSLWTGNYLQLTLMCINPGEDIGLELHNDTDQFLRVEQGKGIVKMGRTRNNMSFQKPVYPGSVILIPAGVWHNVINTRKVPLKMYSIYAPPHHPDCTVHQTKEIAQASEAHDDIDMQFMYHR